MSWKEILRMQAQIERIKWMLLIFGLLLIKSVITIHNEKYCTPSELNISVIVKDTTGPKYDSFNLTCTNWGSSDVCFHLGSDVSQYFLIVKTSNKNTPTIRTNTSVVESGSYKGELTITNSCSSSGLPLNIIPITISVIKHDRRIYISPLEASVNITEDSPIGQTLISFTVDGGQSDNITLYSDDIPDEFAFSPIVDGKFTLKVKSRLDIDHLRTREECGCTHPWSKCVYRLECLSYGVVFGFNVKVSTRDVSNSTSIRVHVYYINEHQQPCVNTTQKIPRSDYRGKIVLDVRDVCSDEDFEKIHFSSIKEETCNGFLEIDVFGLMTAHGVGPTNKSSCQYIFNVLEKDYITIISVTFEFLECPADIGSMNEKWGVGFPGQFMNMSCPEGYSGSISRFCNLDYVYEEPYYNCTSAAIHKLLIDVSTNITNAEETLDKLSEVTSTTNEDNSSLLVGDIDAVNEIMSKITDVINTSSTDLDDITDKFLEVGSNILSEDTTSTWQSSVHQKHKGAESVLENIDKFAEKISTMQLENDIEVPKTNLYFKVGKGSNCRDNVKFPNRKSANKVPIWAKHTPDIIENPCSSDMEKLSYSAVLYRNLSKLMSLDSSNISEAVQINAPILSFSLHPNERRTLDKPISLTFGLYNEGLGDPNCSYWSVSERTWSTEGCWVESYNEEENTVTCKCNHLTNFAILMSPSYRAIGAHHEALSMITIIGCVLSMICLCFTIIAYVLFWHYVKSVRSIIHINLSCSLFITYLLFITGVDQTRNKDLCMVIAISLHLVLMIVFFTMLVEGFNLAYIVLNPISRRKPGIPLQIGAYVLSFIVVGVSLAVRFDGYGGKRFCWLSFDDGLIWGFIGPVIFVFVVNVTIIVAVLWRMFGTATMSKRSGSEKAKTAVRNIVILMPTMGLSWIFGIFSLNEDTIVFQYLFAITNSLQGLLIFILHVVLNVKIQEAVKNRYIRWQSSQMVSTSGKTASPKISATSM